MCGNHKIMYSSTLLFITMLKGSEIHEIYTIMKWNRAAAGVNQLWMEDCTLVLWHLVAGSNGLCCWYGWDLAFKWVILHPFWSIEETSRILILWSQTILELHNSQQDDNKNSKCVKHWNTLSQFVPENEHVKI